MKEINPIGKTELLRQYQEILLRLNDHFVSKTGKTKRRCLYIEEYRDILFKVTERHRRT